VEATLKNTQQNRAYLFLPGQKIYEEVREERAFAKHKKQTAMKKM